MSTGVGGGLVKADASDVPVGFGGELHTQFDAGRIAPASTVTGVEKSNTVSSGEIDGDAVEGGLVPLVLVAVTMKVYAVPSVRPVRRSCSSWTRPPGQACRRSTRRTE